MVDGVSDNIGIGLTSNGNVGNGFGGALGSFSVLGGTNSLVSVDALQEFRIQTSTYAPEFGRTPGGQISILTRSGTNQYHGTVFEYLRNDVLDADNWFNTSVTPAVPKAQERQNDFGGTFAGPILKDRTFFFFSYEGLRLRLPQTTLTTVPCDSTCLAFGNARAMAVSAMQPYLKAYPMPNGQEVFRPCTPNVNGCPASGQQPTGAAQFNASYSNPATLDAYSLRIDQRLTNKLNVFWRYYYSPSDIVERGGGFIFLSTLSTSHITIQTATIGSTWTLSSVATNDLRFNYSRTNAFNTAHLDKFGGAVPLASLPLPSPFSSENADLTLQIFSLTGRFLLDGAKFHNLQRQINIVDNFSVQKGSHTVNFGADFRRLSPVYTPFLYRQAPNFRNVPSAETGSLSNSLQTSGARAAFLFHHLGLFAQDTWRVLPRLTLTYGLRWDVDFAPSSDPSFPAATGFSLTNLANLALAPSGTPPFKTGYGNFAPRIGLAYP